MSDAMLDSELSNDSYEESGLLSMYLKEINRIPFSPKRKNTISLSVPRKAMKSHARN